MQTEDLEKRVSWWKWGIAGFALTLVIAYATYFGWHLGQTAALDADKWGQFGDFVGGLLNPVVAFAAFYWLTQSVKLQKTELAETRKALEGAEQAQKEQAKNGAKNLRISAMAALVSAVQSQIDSLKIEIEHMSAAVKLQSTELAPQKKHVEALMDFLDEEIREDVQSLREQEKAIADGKKEILRKKQKLAALVEERDRCLQRLRATELSLY